MPRLQSPSIYIDDMTDWLNINLSKNRIAIAPKTFLKSLFRRVKFEHCSV